MNDQTTSRLQADVENLARPGGRAVGSAGHEASRRYLLGRLESLRLKPYAGSAFEVKYRAQNQTFSNLVGLVSGRSAVKPPLLIGAHYDTCGSTPGADDNAAAVAIVLEVARRVSLQPLDRDLIVAIFDAEEPPYFLGDSMGSTRFYVDQRVGEIACAFILDLVGHDVPMAGIESSLFITGMESHQDLAAVVGCIADQPGLKTAAILNSYVGDMSDHHIFRYRDVPYLFFSCGHWEHYHQLTDTPDQLNYSKMARIADALIDAAIRADQMPFAKEQVSYDSTPFELRLLNRSFGPLIAGMGAQPLQSRRDIDALVAKLKNRGL